jgi:hypothetical protein
LGATASEFEVEKGLVSQITALLLELGAGFAYMGRQYKLEVGGKEYFLDLLFYNTKLRCYVIIELKIDEFIPEYAGKLQFYLSALDDLVRHPNDNPSVGLLLCKEANKIVAEYALRDTNKPIGVSKYHIGDKLPNELKDLPELKLIQEKLNKES